MAEPELRPVVDSDERESFSIIVCGQRGVGVTTLLGAVLGDKLAVEGNPVSANIRNVSENEADHTVYRVSDFSASKDDVENELVCLMKEVCETNAVLGKAVFCLWFCINGCSSHLSQKEWEWLKMFSKVGVTQKVPLIVVLTNCLDDANWRALRDEVTREEGLNIAQVVPILARDFRTRVGTIGSYGLDELMRVSHNSLTITMDQLVKMCVRSVSHSVSTLKRLNIIVCGKTGVGKSTLLNAVFGVDKAKTDIGLPVTADIEAHCAEGSPLVIYDTPGFELLGLKELENRIVKKMTKQVKEGSKRECDINEAIHCMWYCIHELRYEKAEIEFIKGIKKKTMIPVIIVLTKCVYDVDKVKNLMDKLNEEKVNAPIIPVLALEWKLINGTIKPYGLEELIVETEKALPEPLKKTLGRMQVIDLQRKVALSQGVIGTAVTAASAVGASPIPFSDCIPLIGIQLGMFASITGIFRFKVSKSLLSSIISGVLGPMTGTLAGREIASSLIKLVPVLGSVVGGATAGVLTGAMGEAYVGVMSLVFKGEMSIDDLASLKGQNLLKKYFAEKMKRKVNPAKVTDDGHSENDADDGEGVEMSESVSRNCMFKLRVVDSTGEKIDCFLRQLSNPAQFSELESTAKGLSDASAVKLWYKDENDEVVVSDQRSLDNVCSINKQKHGEGTIDIFVKVIKTSGIS